MGKIKKGILRFGTSGIAVGTKQSFPEAFRQKSRLCYYASIFNSLELNSSFYKVPMPSTFEKWSLDVPNDFRFTIKLWKEVTHVKDLQPNLDHIDTFLNAAAKLGNKKGCLLVQFPGKITLDFFNMVERILERLSLAQIDGSWRIAVEFRNPSWYVGEAYELLDQYGASMVLHDISKSGNTQVNKGAEFIYTRYHGPKGDYRHSYTEAFLQEQSVKINGWLNNGLDVYAYFNNTIGSALENALTLNKLVTLHKDKRSGH